MKYIFAILMMALFLVDGARGQENLRRIYFDPDEEADVEHNEADRQRLHGSISLGGGVMSGWGPMLGYTFVHPELSFKVNDRLQIGGGIGIANGYCGQEVHLNSHRQRDYAPRRRTGMSYFHFDGSYAVNDRLTLYGSVFYVQGSLMPTPHGEDAYAFGGTAAMDYRFGNNNHLSLYLHFMRSRNMPLLWYDDYYMGGWGYPAISGMPFGHRQFAFGMGDF